MLIIAVAKEEEKFALLREMIWKDVSMKWTDTKLMAKKFELLKGKVIVVEVVVDLDHVHDQHHVVAVEEIEQDLIEHLIASPLTTYHQDATGRN